MAEFDGEARAAGPWPRWALDSRLLRHFLAVVHHGNMTAAASALGLTQPALSKSIQHLEQELDVALFVRHAGGVTPTAYGGALARRARLIDAELTRARAEIEAIRGGGAAVVRVGASPMWTAAYLPQAVAALHRDLPRVQVRISSGVIDTLIPRVLSGELDLVCAAMDFPDHAELERESLLEAEHVLVVHRSHRLARRRAVPAAELLQYPWATIGDDRVAMARLGAYFSASGVSQPRIDIEAQTLDALAGILCNGPFIANIAAPNLDFFAAFGIVRLPIRGTLWRFRAGIVHRATALEDPTLSLLITHLRTQVR